MNATQKKVSKTQLSAVDTEGLKEILGCGRVSAVKIGTDAKAKISVGRRVLWNVKKVQEYLDSISE